MSLIDVDSRKRVSLGQARELAERYLMQEDDDGVITLIPAVVMSKEEERILRERPDILAAVKSAQEDIDSGFVQGQGRPRRRTA